MSALPATRRLLVPRRATDTWHTPKKLHQKRLHQKRLQKDARRQRTGDAAVVDLLGGRLAGCGGVRVG